MPDLNDDLFSSFQDGVPPVNPLPASEVRRRGDRMRRRHTTLAAVGGVAAALTVIATPLAVVATQDARDSDPPIAIEPDRVEWRQEVPDGLDVAAGLRGAETSAEPAVPTVEVCGDVAFDAADGTVDVAGATLAGDPDSGGGGTERTLAVYGDATGASAAADRLRDAADLCGTEAGSGNGDSVAWTRDAADLPADDAFVLTQGFYSAGEAFPQTAVYYVVARTGNALLVTHTAGVAPSDAQPAAEAASVADLVTAMEVFSEPVATAPGTDDESALGTTIPDDFPLLAGFPERSDNPIGREGPDRELDLAPYAADVEACGDTPTGLPTPTDALHAGFRESAGGQLRQLLTFASEADAQAHVDAVAAVYAGCPAETGWVHELADEPLAGDHAVSVVSHPETDGEVGPGYRVVQLVRVGSAVLHFTATYDGVDPVDPATAVQDLTTTYLRAHGPVLDAM